MSETRYDLDSAEYAEAEAPPGTSRGINNGVQLRGRLVPPRRAATVEIVLDGVVIGTVDPTTLTGGAQLDLEDCAKTRELIGWLVRYAGADAAQVEALLRPLPLQAIVDLVADISDALGRAIAVPKRSARR